MRRSGKKFKKKHLYLILFLIILYLIINSLYGPFWGKLLYPLDYEREINLYADQYNLDPNLIAAVIYVESRFNPEAVSPKGARGLMQIMPDTARWIASEISIDKFNNDMLFEPGINLEIGSWYLSTLIKQFDGNLPVALASYNGGRSRVTRWLNEGTWDGSVDEVHNIPIRETRNYVEKVLNARDRYQNLYG